MTNRDYVNTWVNDKLARFKDLNTWSNEKVARLIADAHFTEICGEMNGCDINIDCVQCCLKWLEKERVQTEIHEGEVNQ